MHRLFRGSTGDAIGGLTGVFAGFLIGGVAFNDKSLSDVREVEIVVELGGATRCLHGRLALPPAFFPQCE